jgi:hypothetical protein
MLVEPSDRIALSTRLTLYRLATVELAETLSRVSFDIGDRARAAARIRSTVDSASFFPRLRDPIA